MNWSIKGKYLYFSMRILYHSDNDSPILYISGDISTLKFVENTLLIAYLQSLSCKYKKWLTSLFKNIISHGYKAFYFRKKGVRGAEPPDNLFWKKIISLLNMVNHSILILKHW